MAWQFQVEVDCKGFVIEFACQWAAGVGESITAPLIPRLRSDDH